MPKKKDDPQAHAKQHSANAFCGNAGPEEMKHFQSLLDDLSDDEIVSLTDAIGISFSEPTKDIDRDTLEGVLDEADREDFYREYNKLIYERRFINQDGIDRVSKEYAEVCQRYIELVAEHTLSFEEAARRIDQETPLKELHPMLHEVSGLAFHVQTEDWLSVEEKEQEWARLVQLIHDYLAGSWHTTLWMLSGTYMHDKRDHGLSFKVELHCAEPYIEVANERVQKALQKVVAKLNTAQTPERILQNVVLLLSERIGEYLLNGVAIQEYLAERR